MAKPQIIKSPLSRVVEEGGVSVDLRIWADLSRATLIEADLSGADLSGALLLNSDFTNPMLPICTNSAS
jgi:uncharacterized protein YjbI with pentapeptide repeats